MRTSKAKERILQTAEDAIREKGYANLNVNDIAYLAKVSIGTLYYHFPDGKISILTEILSRMQQNALESREILLGTDLMKGGTFDEILGRLLSIVLQQRRKDRQLLAAVQSEMLADLSQYKEVVESYESHETMQQGWRIFVDFIDKISKQFPDDSISIKGYETRIERTLGTLMTYQIMFPNYLGTDEEFVRILLGIIRLITKG
ncbi:MAG: TetR/AcrR family transcriptional regulator [Candidatus Thorarchaeota archaeon]